VVSGHTAAVERAVALASERGAKRALILPVSAPFHCPLMAPAAVAMARALDDVDIAKPLVPIVTNVSARSVTDPMLLRSQLVEQVVRAVRWRESVTFMASQGVTEIVEVGAGRALSGMIRRIDRSISTKAVGTAAGVEALVPTETEEV